MNCRKCGAEIPEQSKFCPNCGKETFYVRRLPIIMIVLLTVIFIAFGIMELGSGPVSIAVATIPGIILMVLIYRLDQIEPEPVSLLVQLFLGGAVLGIVMATVLELSAEVRLLSFVEPGTFLYCLLDAFLVAALIEESCKYTILRKLSWKYPSFNYRFDAVVYSTTVAIGFEITEDLLYLIGSSAGTSFLRAAFPGHCVFGIYMGYYYGRAKAFAQRGQFRKAAAMHRMAVLVAVCLHGMYDFICMYTQFAPDVVSVLLLIAMIAIMIGLNVAAYIKIKRSAYEDRRI